MRRCLQFIIGALFLGHVALLALFVLPTPLALKSLHYGNDSFRYAPLSAISDETKRLFWSHLTPAFFDRHNVDIRNILSLVWQDSFKRGPQKGFRNAQSMVTQNILAYARQESLWQRLQTTIFLIRLDKMMSPEMVFEVYLNTLPIGQELYGLEASTRQYFNKDSSLLSRDEAAFLLALSQFGRHYDPWRDMARVQEIQQEILKN